MAVILGSSLAQALILFSANDMKGGPQSNAFGVKKSKAIKMKGLNITTLIYASNIYMK